MAKEWAKNFYHSREWRRVREVILKRDNYSCRRCGAPGKEVHHIIHLTPQNIKDRRIALGADNLELLCEQCHKDEHKDERQHVTQKTRMLRMIKQDYCFDDEGNLIPPGGVKKNT